MKKSGNAIAVLALIAFIVYQNWPKPAKVILDQKAIERLTRFNVRPPNPFLPGWMNTTQPDSGLLANWSHSQLGLWGATSQPAESSILKTLKLPSELFPFSPPTTQPAYGSTPWRLTNPHWVYWASTQPDAAHPPGGR